MTNTYDTSNFLPCPFCGAKPEAMDWLAGPRARIFVDCPNGNYDDEHGGCSVGPQVVGSDMEDAAARWNRRAQVPDDLPPVPYNEHEKKLLKEIESRDYWEEKATELAERVGEYFGLNVGEHSNINCPVQTALEADWQSQQAQGEPYGYVYDGQLLCDEQDFADYFDGAQYDISTMTPVYTAPPSPAAVPEGWKLVPVEPTLGMLAALAWAGDEDLALGHAEINREIISNYGAMLTASPAPEHSGDGNEMVPALRQYRHNYGGGFVFAYDKEQTDRIVTGLVKALEPFAKCARELDGSPEDDIDPADDDEWAKFRLLVSDYRRARAALAAYRKQGGEQ